MELCVCVCVCSLDLQCWLDVEQLKNSDAELLEERITNIRDKYLSSNFLFGASSPATEEQQMRVREPHRSS